MALWGFIAILVVEPPLTGDPDLLHTAIFLFASFFSVFERAPVAATNLESVECSLSLFNERECLENDSTKKTFAFAYFRFV